MQPLDILRKATILSALLLLPVLAGCGDEQAGPQGPPPPLVSDGVMELQDVPITFEYMGRTLGVREIQVRARTGGILLERKYVEGSFVEEGDLLFTIDAERNDANLSQMLGELARNRATLQNAKVERDRMLKVYAQGAVSASERDNAVTAYQSALASVQESEARVSNARVSRKYNEVRAPISGVTSSESLSEGSLISTDGVNGILTTITQLDPFYVTFSIPSAESLRVRRWIKDGRLEVPEEGFELHLRLVDGTMYEHAGRINFMDKKVDPDTGSILTRGEFMNPDMIVLPGQYARVFVKGGVLKNALLVPQRGILFTQQGPIVYVLDENNIASPRPVQLGISIEGNTVVEGGLEPGERIVTQGVVKVYPGTPVNTQMPGPPPGAEAGPEGKPEADSAQDDAKTQPADNNGGEG